MGKATVSPDFGGVASGPGSLAGGWDQFFSSSGDVGRSHLRTFPKEASREQYKEPHLPARPGKGPGEMPTKSQTWGIGGTRPTGRLQLEPAESREMRPGGKLYLTPKESGVEDTVQDTGRKGHVFIDGVDVRHQKSKEYTLEDALQKKLRVPEECRSDARTIHRVAPPGLKGYMGAEYSNGFFKQSAVPPTRMRLPKAEQGVPAPAVPRPPRKTFKQKRAEAEQAEQVGQVEALNLEYEMVSDDEDRVRDLAEPDKVAAD